LGDGTGTRPVGKSVHLSAKVVFENMRKKNAQWEVAKPLCSSGKWPLKWKTNFGCNCRKFTEAACIAHCPNEVEFKQSLQI